MKQRTKIALYGSAIALLIGVVATITILVYQSDYFASEMHPTADKQELTVTEADWVPYDLGWTPPTDELLIHVRQAGSFFTPTDEELPSVAYDEVNRITEAIYEVTSENLTENKNAAYGNIAFPTYKLFSKDAPNTSMTQYAYDEAIRPLCDALQSYLTATNESLIAHITYSYENTERLPRYITIELISPTRHDVSLAFTLFNYDPNRALNYISGRWAGPDTTKTDEETTDG